MANRGLALCLLLLVACKSDEEKLVDANRGGMRAALDSLAALKSVVDAQAPLAQAQWPIPGVKLSKQYDRANTAQIVWSSQLVGTCAGGATVTYSPNGNDYIILRHDHVEYWIGKSRCGVEGNKELVLGLEQRDVDVLLKTKHIAVIRTSTREKPMLDSGEVTASVDEYLKTGKGKKVEHFKAGRLAGDVLVYELATQKLVGGFPFDVTSSNEIKVRGAGLDEMRQDLATQLEAAIDAKIQ